MSRCKALTGKRTQRPNAIITSPPYWQKRAYPISNTTLPNGDYGQLGREDAADDYIDNLAAIMSGLPLREDGVMWINIGDTYADKSLSLIPAQFALAMKRKGWFVRSMIVWYKKMQCRIRQPTDPARNMNRL